MSPADALRAEAARSERERGRLEGVLAAELKPIERLEAAGRVLREQLAEEQAERVLRLDAAHGVARGLSDVVVAARAALPALRAAAEGTSRARVREAIEVLAGALGEST